MTPRCDFCGRFTARGGPGVSWRIEMGAGRRLVTIYRCNACTEEWGVQPNWLPADRGRLYGRNRIGAVP